MLKLVSGLSYTVRREPTQSFYYSLVSEGSVATCDAEIDGSTFNRVDEMREVHFGH